MKILSILYNLICFLFSGVLGSFLIAKFVIPKDIEKKIKELKVQVKNNEIEKKRFLKNLIWVITDYSLGVSKKSSDFKSNEEYKAYELGRIDAINARQEDILKQLSYGIEETNKMFEEDWTKEN